MKLEIISHPHLLEQIFKVTLSFDDMYYLKLDRLDQFLLEECGDSDKISDKLLALEMLARRMEEQLENS